MDAGTKKRLILIGVGVVGIAFLARMGAKSVAANNTGSEAVDTMNIPGLTYGNGQYSGDNGGFQYGGGGSNMYFEGARNTWPAMQTLMPISVAGSTYSTGDMFSDVKNTYTVGDITSNVSDNGKECCCEDPADPTQTVSAAIIVANARPPAPVNTDGYRLNGFALGQQQTMAAFYGRPLNDAIRGDPFAGPYG